MRQQGINGLRGVHAGSCHAWPLPADATCATVARRVFRDAVSEVGLEPGLLDDCILMASELAANTLHARAAAGTGGGGDRFVSVAPDMGGEPISSAGPAPHTPREGAAWPGAVPGCPELWLYLRGLGTCRELVCKVFDCYRGLTVWCRSGVVSLTSPEGGRERWSYADLVEAAEQTVRRYEELELGPDLAATGA
jgi:hypothetical protein